MLSPPDLTDSTNLSKRKYGIRAVKLDISWMPKVHNLKKMGWSTNTDPVGMNGSKVRQLCRVAGLWIVLYMFESIAIVLVTCFGSDHPM